MLTALQAITWTLVAAVCLLLTLTLIVGVKERRRVDR